MPPFTRGDRRKSTVKELRADEDEDIRRVREDKMRTITYDPHQLGTWRVFMMFKGTVFLDPIIWWNVLKLGGIAILSGGLLLALVPSPEKLETKKFHEAVNFIKVFIAFMLGLFLNSCLKRWWMTVTALTDLFLSIKKVVWTLNTCKVDKDVRDRMQKIMLLACYLLECEISSQWITDPSLVYENWNKTCELCASLGLLSAKQRRVLETKVNKNNRSVAVWAWVGSLTRQCKGPGISPPMMTRIAADCTEAIEQMKKIKTYATLQIPFMYAHMLACLVQINNILLAIASGLASAVSIGDVLHHGQAILAKEGSMVVHITMVYGSLQTLFLQIVALIIEPLLYQAFLVIAATLCDPFTHETYGLPMLDYIHDLNESLNEMNKFSEEVPPRLDQPDAFVSIDLPSVPSSIEPSPRPTGAEAV